MKSPGAPPLRREVERRFWDVIATGVTAEQAAAAVGVSQAAGARWFRHGGGMPPVGLAPVCGRYLSLCEREEIAVLRSQGHGLREIARRIGRSPSTVSRELRRNAATRGGGWSTGPRSLSGKPSWLLASRRPRSSLGTNGCAPTFNRGSPVRFATLTAGRSPVPRSPLGREGTNRTEAIAAGSRDGALSEF